MKKLLLIIFSSVLLILAGCIGDDTQEGEFNFLFRYGVTGGNILDTFQDMYIKDMISEPPIVIGFSLTPEEMDSIYQKMVEIDFFSYPDEFEVTVPEGELVQLVTPYSYYYFKVQYNGRTKELTWEDKISNPDEKADKLKELINLIINIVESKEEYKNLPQPSSGYL